MIGVRGLATFALVLTWSSRVVAETQTFKNSGLKNEITVRLDVRGRSVSGEFVSSDYSEEEPLPQKFSGTLIDRPKGKTGVYMQIRFDSEVPYSAPSHKKLLIWYLKIVNHRAHLFIPMQERSYEGDSPKWIVSDVELEPIG